MTEALKGKDRRHLRGLGHALEPVVRIGKGGVDAGVVRAVDDALTSHELIKVKLTAEAPDDRHDVAERLATELRAHVAQVIGGTILLYRRNPEKPKIKVGGVGKSTVES